MRVSSHIDDVQGIKNVTLRDPSSGPVRVSSHIDDVQCIKNVLLRDPSWSPWLGPSFLQCFVLGPVDPSFLPNIIFSKSDH